MDNVPIEIQIMECADGAAALARAEQWGRRRLCPVRLYKVPAVNLTLCHSLDFWPDIKVIADIPAQDKYARIITDAISGRVLRTIGVRHQALYFFMKQSVGGDEAFEFHRRFVETHLAAVDIGDAAAGFND